MIFITKWVERRIKRKQEKKREETKLKNWFKLYKILHGGDEPTCTNCANSRDCFEKYGSKKEKWPLIDGQGSCQSFKAEPKSVMEHAKGYRGLTGTSGISGMTGIVGKGYNIGGFSGYVKYNGQIPPWRRGTNSCNHQCQSCVYLVSGRCSKP